MRYSPPQLLRSESPGAPVFYERTRRCPSVVREPLLCGRSSPAHSADGLAGCATVRHSFSDLNRLAHLYFMRELAGVPAWFVNLCFVGDPHRPTPPMVWQDALQSAKASLGLSQGSIPFCADIILEAAGHELFQTPPRVSVAKVALAGGTSVKKEWRFLRSEHLRSEEHTS